MKSLKDYIYEYIDESKEDEVYVVTDETGAILSVFDDEEDAEENKKTFPKEVNPEVKKMKRSEIEKS